MSGALGPGTGPDAGSALVGRAVELAAIGQLLSAAEQGRGGALLLAGPAGIEKSALVRAALDAVPRFQVLRAVGIESKMAYGYAGLHQLVHPILDAVRQLPEPQRAALDAVLRRARQGPIDPFLVGLAALNLFAAAGRTRPIVVVVDDAPCSARASASTGWVDAEAYEARPPSEGLLVYRFDAPLFFANVRWFRQRVRQAMDRNPGAERWVVIDFEGLEPLLKARADELAPGRIRFGHELVDLDQGDEAVTAAIRDNATGRQYSVRSAFVIGADGGRLVHRLIGVEYEGLGVLTQTATLYASAEFSTCAPDPDVLIRWIYSPQAGALVVMVPMGPERWGPQSEEWVIRLNYPVDDPRAQSDAQVEADVRDALGIADLPMTIHKITRWSVEAVLASSFHRGRVFLVGDAAHRHPPTGGLGLTSAIHDVHNLCWKVAAVLAGDASPALLDTYEAERRPVDERNCQRSLENAVNHFAIAELLGVAPANTAEQNLALLRRMWSGRPEDVQLRSQRASRDARSVDGVSELNVEYGYTYESAAVVGDDSPAPEPIDDVRVYQPSTRPGAPLPHLWLDDDDGNRRPINDLVAPGRSRETLRTIEPVVVSTVTICSTSPVAACPEGRMSGCQRSPPRTA